MNLREKLVAVREAVDEALRALDGVVGTPPPIPPQSRPPEQCPQGGVHNWQMLNSFGNSTPSATTQCGKCGGRKF